MSARVFFYVQHLLGIGHLRRAAVIARALDAAGFDVLFVTGGAPVPHLSIGGARLLQLAPALAGDEGFATILDAAGRPIDDAWRMARRDALLAAFAAEAPDILLIELFPFGRRPFRFELLPLLEAAAARPTPPRVACSVRDILVDKPDPKRQREIVALVERFYDRVLVHGDPRLFRIEESFPAAAALADRIEYTGYVVESGSADPASAAGRGEVVVSAGGGAVGLPLLRAALAARPLCRAAAAPWRLIAGPNLPDAALAGIAAAAPPGVSVERFRRDFPTLLRNCLISLSQGGYNTVMDLLVAGARAVIVPFAAGNEMEQTLRARRLAARGLVGLVEAADLTPERLAAALDAALDRPPPPLAGLDLDGAAGTARCLQALAVR
ncbi:MAG: glycosyltransferase [Dongiaceae bacterium]